MSLSENLGIVVEIHEEKQGSSAKLLEVRLVLKAPLVLPRVCACLHAEERQREDVEGVLMAEVGMVWAVPA